MAMAVPFFLAFSLLLHLVLFHSVLAQTSCAKSFDCGEIGPISFPFSNFTDSQCGLCKVACEGTLPQIQLGNEGPLYEVIENNITQTHKILVKIRDQTRQIHLDDRSCDTFSNYTFPNSPSISFTIPDNLTLFKCETSSETSLIVYSSYGFYNYSSCKGQNSFYRYPDDRSFTPANLSLKYSVIQLPLNTSNMEPDATDPFDLLAANFSIQLHVSKDCQKCHMTGGQCQNDNQKFHCATKQGGTDSGLIPSPGVSPLPSAHKIRGGTDIGLIPSPGVAPLPSVHKIRGSNSNLKIKVVIGIAATGMAIVITLFCYFTRKCLSSKFPIFGKLVTEDNQNFEAFLKNFRSLAPTRYSYSKVKKITNSFKDRLGQGGFGSVYKGKLPNGHLVAVKVLKESKGNGEEFVNEVASISRTSHVNIVTLLGFCFEGHKRALIYEFMPNGSLEKFIYEKSSSTERQLGWETLYKVAVGIARGSEYLHLGCRTRILHFDIKPHNILLDEDFCPKISDFGLAKLCLKKESIISMLGTRGTAGYIAPEVFCRNYGGVSYKSDVYSYGMMILEMVGGRKNVDVGVDHTSEIYFPDWIYSRLEPNEEIGLHGITNEEENERSRKMIIVGLWCIQTDPSNRPSMSRVVEMLEGSLESLQIPPKPFLSSPPRARADSTTT